MAIFHLSVQTLGRTSGANALAAAAYRSGEKLGDYDYSKRKNEVEFSSIYAPEKAPEWCLERAGLWSAVEEAEKRKDAQLCREMNFALPLELNSDQRRTLVEEYAKIFTEHGMVVDAAIHKSKDGKNPHAHIMLTMRELKPNGFGKKNREWNRRELVENWREKWAELANLALQRAGHSVRIDHRSLAAQGIDHEPTIHQGKSVTHMPGQSLIKEWNRVITAIGGIEAEKALLKAELEKVDKEMFRGEKSVREAQDGLQAPNPSAQLPTEQELERYTQELVEIVKKYDTPKIMSYYVEWIKPYIEMIKTAKDHKSVFEKSKDLVVRDFTTDKKLLSDISREIGRFLKGTGGTLAQQMERRKAILARIRQSNDREAAFKTISTELQRQRGQSLGRGH